MVVDGHWMVVRGILHLEVDHLGKQDRAEVLEVVMTVAEVEIEVDELLLASNDQFLES